MLIRIVNKVHHLLDMFEAFSLKEIQKQMDSFFRCQDVQFAGIFDIHDPAQQAYQHCSEIAYQKIYRAKEVLDVELAGYHIFSHLIDTLTEAVMNQRHAYSKLLLQRIPEQYDIHAPTVYGKVQCVLDYISGMTDRYAVEKFKENFIPMGIKSGAKED